MTDKKQIESWFRDLQKMICLKLEEADGQGKFLEDEWSRKGGGGGFSRVMSKGKIIEKGGVNFSAVFGKPEGFMLNAESEQATEFFATGVSIVIHPNNPWVPIIHMNVRYFELSEGTWWFGGGIDLTPHYIIEDDARFFHKSLKEVCDRFSADYYRVFKKWADDYFFINHRNETRGIGGIFFDRIATGSYPAKEELFEFVKAVGESFPVIYTELMKRNSSKQFTEIQKQWQLIRRGRYAEFNLVYDKGTKFGLETNGRIESILMSLPPFAAWEYNYIPESGSPEEHTLELLKKDVSWV